MIIVGSRSKFAGEKTGAATNINNTQLMLLPSINRSFEDFTRLSPYSGGRNGFGGRDGRLNNVTIDGANFNNNFGLNDGLSGGGNPISLDAIDELQVSIAPYDVRQANFVGAGINAITKSGTNTYKGSAYMYIRNEKLRGNSVDGTDLGTRAEEATRTYGFTLGGPIIKNKLFFFVNGEYEDSPSPIHKWKLSNNGIENGDLMISRVTANDMENFANVLRNKYDYDPGSYTNYSGGTENKKFLARVDWNINTNHKLTARYNFTKNVQDNPTNGSSTVGTRSSYDRISRKSMAFRNACYTVDNLVNSLTVELNSRFSEKISNQVLGTFTKISDMRGSGSSPFPHIDIWEDGDPFMTAGYELFTWNNGVKNNIYTLVDNFTYYVEAHKLTAGISYEDQWVSNSYMRFGTGYYRYASFDDFANGGAPVAFGLTYGYGGELNPAAELRFGQLTFYLQDEWDITNRFKLTAGIRGDYTMYLNDLEENTAISAATFMDGQKINTGLWPKSRVLWSPRVGFNWDVYGDKSLKVRGGTGIFTGRIPLVFFTNMPTNSGMIQNTYTTTDAAVLEKFRNNMLTDVDQMKQLLGLPDQAEATLPSSIAAVDPDFKLPQV
ncbi:MAG: TonB-dependent receptor [Tannerellaceae bacterium]|nr:TonB-dependent receptor [Tannerellaceae bacterium]